jgi:hypothetical protein
MKLGKEQHEFLSNLAKMVILKDGNHMPMHFLSGGLQPVVLADSICDDDSKQEVSIKIRELIQTLGSDTHTFICEANMYQSKEGEFHKGLELTREKYEEIKRRMKPRDVLMIRTETKDGKSFFTVYDVVRNNRGEVIKTILNDNDNEKFSCEQFFSGKFCNMFNIES